MDTIVIALISVITCVILFAFYFQFKFVGVDTRVRDAEKVATKFTNVLEATTVGEDLKKNYQAVQTRLTDLQEENDFNTEDVSAHGDEIEQMKMENRLMREYFAKLADAVKGLPVEGANIPDLTLPEVPRAHGRRDERHRYESEDEDDYLPPSRAHRRDHHSSRPSRYEEEPVPVSRGRRAGARPSRSSRPSRYEEEEETASRGRRAGARSSHSSRPSRYEEEEEPASRGRRAGARPSRASRPSRPSRYEETKKKPVKERRGRPQYDGYDSDEFMP